MNDNNNDHAHQVWHYGGEFWRKASAECDDKLLSPVLIRQARNLYLWFRRDSAMHPVAVDVKPLGDGRFDLTKSVEVVPLGCYTDYGEMVRDLRMNYGADPVREIQCDGGDVVTVWCFSGADLTEGLEHVVTTISCGWKYYPLLVIAMRDE